VKIIGYELKKIWQPATLLIVAVLSFLYYFLFISFDIEIFPNGHPATEDVAFSKELLQRYGSAPGEEQVHAFIQERREQYQAEAEKWIAGDPAFAGVGIHNYADYLAAKERPDLEEAVFDVIWTLYGDKVDFVGFKLQSIDYLETRHDNYLTSTWPSLKQEAATDYEHQRLEQIKETGEYRQVLSSWVYDNTLKVMVYFSMLVVLATLALLAPLIVRDHSRQMRLLQYSSRLGRRLIRQQLAAVILSSIILTTFLLAVMGLIYSSNDTWMFWNSGLSSYLNSYFHLLPLTYGQYILVYIAILYAISIGSAMTAFVLSRFSQNIITLVIKLIPAFAALGLLCYSVISLLFASGNRWYRWTRMVGIEPVVVLVFLGLGCLLAVWITRREHKIDWV
jgi:hypothetical protein